MTIVLVILVILTATLCEIIAAVVPLLVALAVPPAERPGLAQLIAATGDGGRIRRALALALARWIAARTARS